MRRTALVLLLLLQPWAGCGGGDEDDAPQPAAQPAPQPASKDKQTRTQQLREAVAGCDLVYVGEDFDPNATIRTPAEIKALVEGIEFDDESSGWVCRCIGEPCLVFISGEDEVLAELIMHHGVALWWIEGPWKGLSQLKVKSQWFLCRWLAKHGCRGPLEDLERREASAKLFRLREQRYDTILPASTWRVLQASRSRLALKYALEHTVDAPLEQLRLLLRMYGCHPGEWTTFAGRDDAIHTILLDAPRKDLLRLLVEQGEDPDLLGGLARVFFEDRRRQSGSLPDDPEDLARLARHGVRDPRRKNRRRTMARLAADASPTAIAILREVLAGTLPPRSLPSEWAATPRGLGSGGGRSPEVDQVESDRIAAAWLLAEVNDESSREAIRRLVEETTESGDLAVVRRAYARLER